MLMLRIFSASILVLLVGSALASPTITMDNNVTVNAVSPRPFDYIVVIVMENWNVNQTYNCGPICDPFLTPFADAHAFSVNFKSTFNGSLTSYFALTMAQHNVPAQECTPDHNGTPGLPPLLFCPQSSKNVADIIEGGGLTWKVYAEDYPSSCGSHCSLVGNCYDGYTNPGTDYAGSHNPFVYYTDIAGNSTRCSRVVPANSQIVVGGPQTDDNLLGDLNSPSTPNFMWLIPNECDQMHHLCGDWGLSDMRTQGSMYLSRMVLQILASNVFQSQRAVLFITYDECQNIIQNDCYLTSSDATNRIYGLWASSSSPVGSSVVKQNFKSNLPHNHYSFLHTLEWAWNLPPMANNDATASVMKEFFK